MYVHICEKYMMMFSILKYLLQHSTAYIVQGEQYKLFWPEQSEFVRVAARFGAKIIPFGVVGEDDFGEVSLITKISFSHCFFIND